MPGALARDMRLAAYVRSLVRLARPHQWIKNAFVLVGLVFGHGWLEPALIGQSLAVFAAFCLASSAVYVGNDVMDREADRAHPGKRERPIASGAVGIFAAWLFCNTLATAALVIAGWVSTAAVAIVAGYLLLNAAYSAGLKHVAILDVVLIAAGFMLRILAGTAGIGIEPSKWLLFVGLMLTLFLGFSKRRAELGALGDAGPAADAGVPQRPVLASYSVTMLDRMVATTAVGAALGYGLYTVDPDTVLLHGTKGLILTLPFVVYGLFRYLFLVHRRGGGADPAWELLHDPHLVVATLAWFAATCAVLAGK
jgi:4-hydroxybenzoate polyprenyltransferase